MKAVVSYIDVFMDARLHIDKLISNSCGLDEINEAYEALERERKYAP